MLIFAIFNRDDFLACNMETTETIREALAALEEACTASLEAKYDGDITEELYDEINHTIAHLESKLKEAAEPKTISVQLNLGCPSGSTNWGNLSWNFEITDSIKNGYRVSADDKLEIFKDQLSDFMSENEKEGVLRGA